MADISQVKLPNGDTYNLVDETSGYITTSIYSGTCASAAADTTKIVACSDFTDLKAGAAILVTFNTTNTAAVGDLTLNVNNTGAKKIQYINNGTRGNLSSAGYLKASTTYLFVYDGTYWVAYFNYNTTYSSMTDAEITAGTGTTARTITPARLKTAVGTWAPVTSVNGQTGAVTIAVPSNISAFTNDSGYITSYTETDPVFSASAAAGITSTDISNWNSKVSDDKTWNGVTLTTTATNTTDLYYVPTKSNTELSGSASWMKATSSPTNYAIAKYNGSAYLSSTTPSANDNSTKVATTAYVDAAVSGIVIPTKTSDLTNDSGFISQFVITLTEEYDATAGDYVWTMDKTITEINTAYNAGKELVCKIAGYEYIPLKSASYSTNNSEYYFEIVTFPYSNAIGANKVSILYDGFNENLTITVSYDSDHSITLATPDSYFVVPAGGTTGQVLMKTDDYDYDFAWTDLPIYNGTVV